MEDETKKLYFDDPYQVEFNSKVLKKISRHDKPAVILEQTCFYPESGGQPADKGSINGIEVTDVIEEDGNIIHLLDRKVESDVIQGKLDWEIRFDHMQQHAGQHVLSQSFYELTRGETLSFHMGEENSTVEIDVHKISEREVAEVEKLANSIVFQNKEIKSYFVSEDQIVDVPLRGLPKKSGRIRVVEVSGFDYTACGGTHPQRTGEIGMIKILKLERIRNNIKFEFLCGKRALRDYIAKNIILNQVAVKFSVNHQELPLAAEKLFSDFQTLKKTNKKTQRRISRIEAREIIQEAKDHFIHNIFTDKTTEELRFLALNIIETPGLVVFLGLKKVKKVHVVLARSNDFDIDMRELVPIVAEQIKGKGGGRPVFVEIAGNDPKNLEAAVDEVEKYISGKTRLEVIKKSE
jgi:alanyl-tRNA synthetase